MDKKKTSIATLIIGEGETEQFYMISLKNAFPQLRNVRPELPKHSSLEDMEAEIVKGIEMGYDQIFCLIDMDTKDDPTEAKKYASLRKRYNKPVVKKKKGINCRVEFFETHRCIELFFLYYFKYTTKPFRSCNEIIKDLIGFAPYEKEINFFRRHPIHQHFTTYGGSLVQAIKNAEDSLISKSREGREYTFSEMGRMLKQLIPDLKESKP
ncbi:MAG: RloB family protein [Bacteroidales bacterium]|nr:RloB family protein [Bacteroidales bacterium]